MVCVVNLLAVYVLICLTPEGQAGVPGVTEDDITVSPVTVAENVSPLVVTLSRTVTTGDHPFSYKTADGTAVAGADYEAKPPSFGGFFDGTATTTISITIIDNEILGSDKTFVLMLSNFNNPQPAFNVTITIVENEVVPIALTFQSTIMKSEVEGTYTLTISRSADTTRAFTATIATIDGTASSGADYQSVSTVLNFAEGDSEKTLDFVIIDDRVMESSESFIISITGDDIPSSNITFVIMDDDSPDDFNCEREPSQVCWNGGTCQADGECNCAPGYAGADCLTVEAMVNDTGCDDRCGANGDCISTGSPSPVISCDCHPGYAGEHCDHKAYAHECNQNNFTVCISPHSLSKFQGMVYVRGMRDAPGCQLTLAPLVVDESDGLLDWCQGYAATLEYAGNACGDFGPIPGSNVTYILELIVQYNNASLSPLDELVTFTCSYSNSTQTVYAETEVSINPSELVLKKQGGSGEFNPISLTLNTVSDQPLPDVVELGDEIKVCAVVDADTGMQAVLITKVTVNNTRLDVPRSRVLYENGCSDVPSQISDESPYWLSGGNKNTMCVDITAFFFESDAGLANPKLGVVVDALVFQTPSEANKLACTARRKRAAASEAASVSGTIVLRNPTTSGNIPGQTQAPVNQGPVENVEPVSTATTCEDKEWLMPVIIALGVILAFMLGTIIVLGYAMFRRRSEPRKYVDEPEPRHRHYR